MGLRQKILPSEKCSVLHFSCIMSHLEYSESGEATGLVGFNAFPSVSWNGSLTFTLTPSFFST